MGGYAAASEVVATCRPEEVRVVTISLWITR